MGYKNRFYTKKQKGGQDEKDWFDFGGNCIFS